MYRLFLLPAIIIVIVFLIFYVIRRLKKNILENIKDLQEFFEEIGEILKDDDEIKEVLSNNNFDLTVEVSENMSFLDAIQANNSLITKKSMLLKLMRMTKLEDVNPENLKIYYKFCRRCEGRDNSKKCDTCFLIRNPGKNFSISIKYYAVAVLNCSSVVFFSNIQKK